MVREKVMTSIKNIFKIGFIMFGTLVGAGFASGKEIWVYFAKWGNISFLMIFLTAVLFFLCSLLFFYFGKKFQITTVQKSNMILFKKYSIFSEILMFVSNVLVLSSMFAGADSLFFSVFPNFEYRIMAVVSAIISLIVVCFGFSGVTKTNAILVPLLLLCIGTIFVYKFCDPSLVFQTFKSTKLQSGLGLLYALLFVCSNMFFSGFIFSKMGANHTKKELIFGGVVGSVLLFLSLISITALLFLCPDAVTYDMPIVFLGASLNGPFGYFVLFVVWLGLLSTAFALLFTTTNYLKSYFHGTFLPASMVCVVSLLLSGIGFSYFVSIVYPLMGALGFLCVVRTGFVCFFGKRKNTKLQKKLKRNAKKL